MNSLELALKCENGCCDVCPCYDTACKDFMRSFQLTPNKVISILKWNTDGLKTMLDAAIECSTVSKCSKCEYKSPRHCPEPDACYTPDELLKELFKEVK